MAKFIICLSLLLYILIGQYRQPVKINSKKNKIEALRGKAAVYEVSRLTEPMKIDANWNKPQWEKVPQISINNYMGKIPAFRPEAAAKMMYDDDNVYVIFRVKDRYVHSVVQDYNGNVSGDACVEFFFAPDSTFRERYFNLEVNAGGTPLMFYVTKPWTGFTKLDSSEIKRIEIAHSLPKVVDPEITEPVTWTIEYCIPLSVLQRYSNVTRPKRGVAWKANFYKTASLSSNPHWITWSPVNNPKPNFHLPQFFGTLEFQ